MLPTKDGAAAGKCSCIFTLCDLLSSPKGSSAPFLAHNFSGYISTKLAVDLYKRSSSATQSNVGWPMVTCKIGLRGAPKDGPSAQVP